jgi:hypothetical protein
MPSPFNVPEENKKTSNYFTQFIATPHTIKHRKSRKNRKDRKNRKSRKNRKDRKSRKN